MVPTLAEGPACTAVDRETAWRIDLDRSFFLGSPALETLVDTHGEVAGATPEEIEGAIELGVDELAQGLDWARERTQDQFGFRDAVVALGQVRLDQAHGAERTLLLLMAQVPADPPARQDALAALEAELAPWNQAALDARALHVAACGPLEKPQLRIVWHTGEGPAPRYYRDVDAQSQTMQQATRAWLEASPLDAPAAHAPTVAILEQGLAFAHDMAPYQGNDLLKRGLTTLAATYVELLQGPGLQVAELLDRRVLSARRHAHVQALQAEQLAGFRVAEQDFRAVMKHFRENSSCCNRPTWEDAL